MMGGRAVRARNQADWRFINRDREMDGMLGREHEIVENNRWMKEIVWGKGLEFAPRRF